MMAAGENSYVLRQEMLKSPGGLVTLDKDDKNGLAIVRISNPKKKNAFTGKMIVDFWDILSELERWDCGRALLVESDGDCFCSGADLDMVRFNMTKEAGRQLADGFESLADRIQNLPFLTVAAIQGKALGGGAELTTCFDLRVMTPEAQIRFVQSRMGITTGIAGGGTRLTRLVGYSNALKLLLSGEPITAQKAISLGLANHILNGHQTASDWVLDLFGDRDVSLIRAFKRIVINASDLPLQIALREEKEIFVSEWGGTKFSEALGAGLKHK